MTVQDRVRRPVPERTEPIRNWGTLFGGQSWQGGAAPSTSGSSANEDSPRAQAPADPISGGVQAGYRVIEDYVRQGQNAARLVWGPMMGASGGDGGNDIQQRFGAMMRSATDLATLWLDLVAAAPGGRPPWSGGAGFWARPSPSSEAVPVPPFSAGETTAASPEDPSGTNTTRETVQSGVNTAVTLDIVSTRRTEVIVDLKPHSAGHPLRAHDLRSADPDKSRLSGIVVEGIPGEDRIIIRLRVPADHPPGLYSGVILDDRTSLPRGTLAVRIVAEDRP